MMHCALRLRALCLLLVSLPGLALHPARADGSAAPDYSLAPKLVDALDGVFGQRPGLRKAHPKGVCVAGSFTPDAGAAGTVTSARAYTGGKPYAVIGRFSIAGGNPLAPDNVHSPRGFALRLAPTPEDNIDLVLLSAPMFGASTPEEFLGLLTAVAPDAVTGKQDKERIGAFFQSHPGVTRQPAWLNSHPVSASYASTDYYGVHAFRFVDAAGHATIGKIVVRPVGGALTLSDAEAQSRGPDFLIAELEARLSKGPAALDVLVQLGQPGDPTRDPSLAWPEDRPTVHLGRVELERSTGSSCNQEMFDPSRLAAGVEVSDDPVLPIRSAAYGVSFSRRLGGH